jgi:hypothetical protein
MGFSIRLGPSPSVRLRCYYDKTESAPGDRDYFSLTAHSIDGSKPG